MKRKSQKNNKDVKKGKALTFTSSVSGVMGFLGGYQICHNICLGIIALLSIIGIAVVGMPLLFLTKVAVPFWIAAVVLFGITLAFYFKKKCISKNLLTFNAGIITAGVPFPQLQNYSLYFWLIGGTIVLLSLISFIKERYFQS